ncbi:MAG: hypothetical protein ABEL76_02630 [Bradymonadaceae bacterium]
MLDIAPVDLEAARRAREAEGGFLWWYVDVVGPDGEGLVAIWSYGLPFLPGYAASDRKGHAPPAAERPSLNLALYRNGEPDFYLLREYEPERAVWTSEESRWEFGETVITSARCGGERRVHLDIDCSVPGTDERVNGDVRISGPVPSFDELSDGSSGFEHRWEPGIVGGGASVDLEMPGATRRCFEGAAYHDANCGTTPFHRLGIQRWIWARLPHRDGELVFYALRDENGPGAIAEASLPHENGDRTRRVVLEFDGDGNCRIHRDVQLTLGDSRRDMAGMQYWRRLTWAAGAAADWSPLTLEVDAVVDRGPFYMRLQIRQDQGERGFAELIRPRRIDLDRHRPLVRMAVDQSGERNSAWLPLFSGPREGRLQRLVSYNTGWGRG